MMFRKTWSAAAFACWLSLLAPPAQAQDMGFIGPRPILGIDIGDSAVMILRLGGTPICQGQNFVYVESSQSYFSTMYAMALAAYNAGKPINVWVSGCNGIQGRIVRMVQGGVF
jgi:hypothetical protein